VVQPGTLLEGKYEILDKIREGGMGSIYRVRHRLLDEIRVVKVMKPGVVADADLRRRFVEEARTATRLKHPNICTIHDFAIDDSGMAYLVMEFIEGVNVSDLLKLHGRPALPLALEIAHQSLLALGFLHRKGIVHRDVAPDNIMLTRDEQGGPAVKLIDLGIAKVAEAPVEATATGVFLGKLKYASPEQYGSLPKGHRLDGRSDLYGLGVVLYELLTGVLPFEGSTVVELLKAHVFAPPRPFSESDPEGRLPAELRGAVLKSLQKKREDRFANAEEFDREILAIRSRHLRPENVEQMRVELARIRPSGVIRVEPATPSAQGEIDRQFAALKTPTPSRRTGEDDRTAVAPEPVPMPRPLAPPSLPHELVPTTPIPRVPSRRAPLWLIAAALAVIAVGGVLWATSRRRPEPQPSAAVAAEPTPAASEPAATAAFPAAPEAAAPRQPEPTPEPAEPTPQPPPTAAPRAPTRVAVLAPRNVAQPSPRPAVGASVLIPTAPAPAATPFVSAAGAPPPAEAPQATVPAPAPPPSARPAPTEADRIRETIRLYETAQNTLDTDLYVRVFPSVDRSRVEQAFSSFRSQSVGFEIRKIEMSPQGTSAQVFGFETRVAVPKAGNDLRVTADRVLQLEKRGDAWVIVAVR
jgi:eukaryotic-like serine/threonine-protein kinase